MDDPDGPASRPGIDAPRPLAATKGGDEGEGGHKVQCPPSRFRVGHAIACRLFVGDRTITARNSVPYMLQAIAKYTRKYTQTGRIALFVTLFAGGKGGVQYELNVKLLQAKMAKQGILGIIASLTGNK